MIEFSNKLYRDSVTSYKSSIRKIITEDPALSLVLHLKDVPHKGSILYCFLPK